MRAEGVRRRFGGLRAVDGVDLVVPAGAVTAVIGPNGAGKSTLFDCLAGGRVDAGRVYLGDRDVTRLPPHRRARLGLARTFQVVSVFPTLTVLDNLRVGAENHSGSSALGRMLGLPTASDARAGAAVEVALERLALTEYADTPAGELPAGILRMVELARALAATPSVLLLDEPASGLDDAQTDRLRREVRALAADGLAILLVEHDMDLVFGVADTVHVMAAGKLVASGTPAEIRADAQARQVYL
ncbi:ATP-binding cassette domain-containing protein [Streptomyces sp. SID3343]|nr:ATP-binding cassette domain-containing protein [Streptomyces sp. SID3343]